MKRVAFFDVKEYEQEIFNKYNDKFTLDYYDVRLDKTTAILAKDADAVCVFVNDIVDKDCIDILVSYNIELIALRCAGYSNVDFKYAYNKMKIVRVPVYSPFSISEHAMALLLSLNRKVHKAYIRTRDLNFSLNGLIGFDLKDKTVGVIGTGNIGKVFIDICNGFKMNVIAYDPFPLKDTDINYVELNTLFRESDVISLHCPLNKDTYHIINEEAIKLMKSKVIIINTSRGALIDSKALLNALNKRMIGGAGLDVYEEEGDIFFEDYSLTVIDDDILSSLLSKPNVLITSHQGFLTNEALNTIAKVTLGNIESYFNNDVLHNEINYEVK